MLELRPPTDRDLKVFGLLLPAFIAVAGGLGRWQFAAPRVGLAIWLIGGLVCLIYAAWPAARSRIYRGWMFAVFPLGWSVSTLLMALVYYLVVTPLGLALRWSGYDPLRRRRDESAETYWIPRPEPPEAARYFRQY